jgi:selenocysteine lyase/cysteine desulfurase
MDLSELRAEFPYTSNRVYLNHAAVSPLSRTVRAATEEHLTERHGETEADPIANFEAVQPIMARAKARSAEILGTEPSRVEFVPNTSAGLNVLCRGLDWSSGDRIAVPNGTFPTNVYPFMNLRTEGVEVDFIPTDEGAFTVQDVARTLKPETRLVSVSWVHYLSGFRADLAEIGELCKQRNVLFCVDAIQGLGALPLSVEEAHIDFLAAGGHKWLMGLQGSGILYCTEALQQRLRPPTGWLHGPVDWENLDHYQLVFHEDARRFRTGTLNAVGIRALDAALGLYLKAGPEACAHRILTLSERLAKRLQEQGLTRYGSSASDRASGIVTVVPDAPEALFEHLQTHGITAALRNRKLRLSPSYYNNEADLQAVVEAVAAFRE